MRFFGLTGNAFGCTIKGTIAKDDMMGIKRNKKKYYEARLNRLIGELRSDRSRNLARGRHEMVALIDQRIDQLINKGNNDG